MRTGTAPLSNSRRPVVGRKTVTVRPSSTEGTGVSIDGCRGVDPSIVSLGSLSTAAVEAGSVAAILEEMVAVAATAGPPTTAGSVGTAGLAATVGAASTGLESTLTVNGAGVSSGLWLADDRSLVDGTAGSSGCDQAPTNKRIPRPQPIVMTATTFKRILFRAVLSPTWGR